VASDGPSIEIVGGQQATIGDLLVCTSNDHSVDAGKGKTLANMHVLRYGRPSSCVILVLIRRSLRRAATMSTMLWSSLVVSCRPPAHREASR
jgi:hypothetical protein